MHEECAQNQTKQKSNDSEIHPIESDVNSRGLSVDKELGIILGLLIVLFYLF